MGPYIEKPETQNRRLKPTGLAKPGKTRGLTGTGPGLAHQDTAGRVFGRFWNRTESFFCSEPGPLAGYPDPLLTLPKSLQQEDSQCDCARVASHILISNNTLLLNGNVRQSMVADDFNVWLLSDNQPLKIGFELLKACFPVWDASWIWAQCCSIIILFIRDIVDHILGRRREDSIERIVSAATTYRSLGTSCAVGLLDMIKDAKEHSVFQFHSWLCPSRRNIVIPDVGNIIAGVNHHLH